MVRAEGLEPPRLATLEPKPSASTNSATPAATASFQVKRDLTCQHQAASIDQALVKRQPLVQENMRLMHIYRISALACQAL
jgi:hypothetical protein